MLITEFTAGVAAGTGMGAGAGAAAGATGLAAARLAVTGLDLVTACLALARWCLEEASAGPAANGTTTRARASAASWLRLMTLWRGLYTLQLSADRRVSATFAPHPPCAGYRR